MIKPLAGIKVLDLSRVLAGPWAGQILADLGADVIKVERPGEGDDTRTWGPPFFEARDGGKIGAGYFLAANRGKRSIELDLSTVDGRATVEELSKHVDVVLENYKTGTLSRYGLGWQDLEKLNPKLIYCSITGFGQTGPRSNEPAYDFLIQAMGGLMSVTGVPDGEPGAGPQKVGIPIVDLMTGVYGACAILAAIVDRNANGKGQYIDMAMLDVQVSVLSNQAMNFLLSDKAPVRTGNAHPNIQPQKVYSCLDGDMIIVVGNDKQFAGLCEALEIPDLALDQRFKENSARVENKLALHGILDQIFGSRERSVWLERLSKVGVPAGPINTIPEVFKEPQVIHRDMVRYIDDPALGSVPQVMSPFYFSGSRLCAESPPPRLGQHTDEILAEFGINR
ncbi:CaiB/BaiF CoA transferase family protein [Lacisediminimonas profundi]|uniref:CaiB/BaiF CoA transferase family protein n=1 Tax=Lacisediminimonas profundi TaxID=2603856 RepID=UPI00124B22B7|nr:CaiB/BaiF CoA-transferase family protein [Lacisediminimonas profundi]